MNFSELPMIMVGKWLISFVKNLTMLPSKFSPLLIRPGRRKRLYLVFGTAPCVAKVGESNEGALRSRQPPTEMFIVYSELSY